MSGHSIITKYNTILLLIKVKNGVFFKISLKKSLRLFIDTEKTADLQAE